MPHFGAIIAVFIYKFGIEGLAVTKSVENGNIEENKKIEENGKAEENGKSEGAEMLWV